MCKAVFNTIVALGGIVIMKYKTWPWLQSTAVVITLALQQVDPRLDSRPGLFQHGVCMLDSIQGKLPPPVVQVFSPDSKLPSKCQC